ncbi:putative flavin-binding monooxygenase-like family protein [Phaeomoniella chlamydospora]|uniref:Putative flavin-binding monooxygenase-like family protein n=1 Tax=Phaeomoniella chlamydospora TaxID=158046 RepID=A0A0G2FWW9_PHACM|nr:putative flavin-binding monooxygenase-like family protein [Phaeomoniella chlamydospora]
MANDSMSSSRPTKVIVIGAGWSGLVAAKTYLQFVSSPNNPNSHQIDITILDNSPNTGGVWSTPRLYPGLLAHSPNGLYEYSDFSMVDAEHPDYDLIPGPQVQTYLEAYAKHFNVYDKIRFGVTVKHVHRRPNAEAETRWDVETSTGETLTCDKLIVASGLYSKPHLPDVAFSSVYQGISIHSKFLGQMHEQIARDSKIKDIIVVGGCKSAIEAINVFLDASPSKRIHWVVRPSDHGVPIAALNPHFRPNLIAMSNTRLFSIFSPSAFVTSGFWYSFLQSGQWLLGTLILYLFWFLMTFVVKIQVGYGRSRNGKLIEPEGSTFFPYVSYISVMVKDCNFLKVLHADDPERLEVRRAKPLELRNDSMLVQEKVDMGWQGWYMRKTEIKADAIIWCTGWQPSLEFFDDKEKVRLGLPHPVSEVDMHMEKQWAKATRESAAEMENRFPYLMSFAQKRKNTPSPTQPITTPFRLYNQIIPVTCLGSSNTPPDKSIVFTSFTTSSQTAILSELGALYAITWLEDLFPPNKVPNQSTAIKIISEIQSWRSLRYGPRGTRDPEIIMEIQGYFDKLCKDLGLQPDRKRRQGKGLFREWLEPYRASDYKDMIEEFLRGHITS